jgi:hypothetical protein
MMEEIVYGNIRENEIMRIQPSRGQMILGMLWSTFKLSILEMIDLPSHEVAKARFSLLDLRQKIRMALYSHRDDYDDIMLEYQEAKDQVSGLKKGAFIILREALEAFDMSYGKMKNAPEPSMKLLDEFMTDEDRNLFGMYQFWALEKRLLEEKRDATNEKIRMLEYQLSQNREKLQDLELLNNQIRDNSILEELVREDTSKLTFMVTDQMVKYTSLSEELSARNADRKSMISSAKRQMDKGAKNATRDDSIFDELLREMLETPKKATVVAVKESPQPIRARVLEAQLV